MNWKSVLPIAVLLFFSLQAAASFPIASLRSFPSEDTTLRSIAIAPRLPAAKKMGFFQKLKAKVLLFLLGKQKGESNAAKAKWGLYVLLVFLGLLLVFVIALGSFRPH